MFFVKRFAQERRRRTAAAARVGFYFLGNIFEENFVKKCYPKTIITNHRSSRTPHAIPDSQLFFTKLFDQICRPKRLCWPKKYFLTKDTFFWRKTTFLTKDIFLTKANFLAERHLFWRKTPFLDERRLFGRNTPFLTTYAFLTKDTFLRKNFLTQSHHFHYYMLQVAYILCFILRKIS